MIQSIIWSQRSFNEAHLYLFLHKRFFVEGLIQAWIIGVKIINQLDDRPKGQKPQITQNRKVLICDMEKSTQIYIHGGGNNVK